MKKNLYILKNKLKINFTNENLLSDAILVDH